MLAAPSWSPVSHVLPCESSQTLDPRPGTCHETPRRNKVYAQAFGDHKPARSPVALPALPRGAQVEIRCRRNHLAEPSGRRPARLRGRVLACSIQRGA
jgi:hypothetical protein